MKHQQTSGAMRRKCMINNIKELKEYLGEKYTIAYWNVDSKKVMVNDKHITLPVSKNELRKELNINNVN